MLRNHKLELQPRPSQFIKYTLEWVVGEQKRGWLWTRSYIFYVLNMKRQDILILAMKIASDDLLTFYFFPFGRISAPYSKERSFKKNRDLSPFTLSIQSI